MARLIDELAKLPGIGRRSAERLAFHVIKSDPEEAQRLARAVADVKLHVRHCRVCFNLAGDDLCATCEDARRDRSSVMVVEQPKDLLAVEATGVYRGLYHVLMGRIDPMDGIGPGELTVEALAERVAEPRANTGGVAVKELILATSPNLDGDGTALYLQERFSPLVRVTRLARGLPTGGQIELTGTAVLADAIVGRTGMPS